MTQDTTSPNAGGWSPRRPILLACPAIRLACLIIGLLCLTIGIGCQDDPATGQPAPEIYRFSVDELSDLGGYLSDLDEGRLRAAPPVEWYVEPRAKDYVTRFVFDRMRQSPLPRITIEARDADFPRPRDVTQANLHEFLAMFTNSLDEGIRQAVEGDLLMLVLGDVPCVAYKVNKQFRVGSRVYPAEREVLVTLSRGRIYTVSLDVYAGKLEDYRADAYAVVAGFQFLQPTSSDNQQPAASEANKNAVDGSEAAESGKTDSTPDAR
jgi:hypothetical protein